MIIQERLAQLDDIVIAEGSHESFEQGVCSMELVAWLAGEPHSAAPKCACPVITRAMVRLNDRIGDDVMRTELLRPLLPKIVGTRASRDVMVKRGFVAADMAVRVFAPIALEARGHLDLAKALRGCRAIVDRETAEEGRRAAAYATARAAAESAYAAAYAADAVDAYAASGSKAHRKVFEEGVRMIERMIAVTD